MKTMKKIIKNTLLLAVILAISASVFTACNNDDDTEAATPLISYVRTSNLAQSDSLITSAYLGNTIALIGNELSNVKEIWFNDQQAKINPVYVTNNAILVNIPNAIPVEVTNKIKLVTRSGIESFFDFSVNVPTPVLNSLRCEYVADGGIATINGDFFLEPKVFFNGNMAAEIVGFTKTEIQVKVPNGSKAGPITVESIYGSTRSLFSFRDNNVQTPTTVVFADFESTSWNTWGLSAFGTEGGPTGQYMILEGTTGSWAWPGNPLQFYFNNPVRKPIVSEGDIKTMALRFEVNVNEWHDTPLVLWFSKNQDTHDIDGADPQAHWKPYLSSGVKSNYVTNGWITVTIPLTDFKYNKDESDEKRAISSLSELVDLHAMYFGSADGTYNLKVWMDNMRIVKYK